MAGVARVIRRIGTIQVYSFLSRQLVSPIRFLQTINMAEVDLRQYTLPNDTGICVLECETAFNALTKKEKCYAHYLSQASWKGGLVCLYQCSPESPGIFLLLQRLFREKESVDKLKKVAETCGLSDEEFQEFLIYVAGFYSNVGNYKSFGDTKIIPKISKDKLSALIEASPAFKADPEGMRQLWSSVKDAMFSLATRELQMGLGDQGISTYFSYNCTTQDAAIAAEFMTAKNLSAYNTRLFKTIVDGRTVYEIRIASSNTSGAADKEVPEASLLGSHVFTPSASGSEPVTFNVTRGDYAPLMQSVCDNLAKAQDYVANDTEKQMLQEYVCSFGQGSVEKHKDGSRFWIRNKAPIIETYIGFIESYRDPYGVRGEFEGFVACVNKEMSAKFSELVEKAEDFLPLLPWPKSYEKDRFLRPDFTSLDVLSFGSSGIPAGINIPNYDDIRQSEGFKNVSLGNVISAGYKDTKVTFLSKEDALLLTELKVKSFEVQVGLHELLGHGSGKMFYHKADGSFNFDKEAVKHTETGEPITQWYEENETYDSKFQAMGSSYEECRAECVGIYLCLLRDILKIFGHEDTAADDIIYINWLNMARAGLLALEFYTPENAKWRQAHMQARYVILRVMLEAGGDFVKVEKLNNPEDGQSDILMLMDRSKIETVGKEAVGSFLRKLQTYKATGDYASAKAMYDRYSEVNDTDAPHFQSLRATVIDRKQPRKMFVQCNTVLEGEDVKLVNYEATPEGIVASFRDRFGPDVDPVLQQLWEKDAAHFPPVSA